MQITSEITGASRCKGWGHSWDDVPTPPWATVAERGFMKVHWRCLRCGTEKEYLLNVKTGEGRPKYRYPKEYKSLTAGSRAEWKLIFVANRKALVTA